MQVYDEVMLKMLCATLRCA